MGLSIQACAHGPYKGRVIDEKSGQPIAGAIAIGNWTTTSPNVGGGTTHCKDAREALTDENGEFEIPDVSSGTFSIDIYKIGYRKVGCMWKAFNRAGSCYLNDPVQFDGDRAILPLKKVAKARLGYEGAPPHVSCGRKDGNPLVEYIKVRREFRRAIGLK